MGSELPHEAKVPYLVEDEVAIPHNELYEYMKEKDMDITDRVAKRVQADGAEDAFKYEMQHFFSNKVRALLDELQDTIFNIQQGNWPSGWEYKVLRHKPMKMTNEEFLNAVVDQYIDWSNKVQDASE